ncbi:MAG: MBL fold metallo-hydrolase [Culicoidibacterales bacterium]
MKKQLYTNTTKDKEVNMIKRTISASRDTLIVRKRKPRKKLPIEKIILHDDNSADNQIAWLGHSSVLVRIEGKTILIDPVFSHSASPLSFVICRFQKEIPLDSAMLTHIDIILLTHNHYDHMDKKTILQLHHKTDAFITPIGVRDQLIKWGVAANKISELAWNQTLNLKNIYFTAQETQHNSRRGLFDRNTSLWCAWIIKTEKLNIYCSGDSGYGDHFKQTATKFGPFDIALIECGQYDKRWPSLHMFPQQSYQAAKDLQTKVMLPIHWGSFTLAFHPWYESVEKVLQLQAQKNDDFLITTPKIGELIDLEAENFPTDRWWQVAK